MEKTVANIQEEIKKLEGDYRIQSQNASFYYGKQNNTELGSYWADVAEETNQKIISLRNEIMLQERKTLDLTEVKKELEKLEFDRRMQNETVDFYLNHRQDEDLANDWKQALSETKQKIKILKNQYGL